MIFKQYQNLPSDWQLVRLDEIAEINPRKKKKIKKNGGWFEAKPGDLVTFLAMEDVSESSQILNKQTKIYAEVEKGYTSFQEDDILIAKITPCFENGKGAWAKGLSNGIGFGTTEFHVLRVREEVNKKWLHYLTTSYFFRKRGELNMQGSAGQKRIPTDFVKSYRLPKPPIVEQNNIVEILSTWDEAISKTEKLIQAKKRYKKGLMQRLLSGKVRFPEFEGEDWVEVKIGSLLKEAKRMDEWDDEKLYELISVRRRSGGIFPRENLYGHEIKTKNLKKVKTGDFLISRMQIVHGASAVVTPEFEDLYVSNSYHSLVKKSGIELDMNFLNYISQLPYFYHLTYISSYGVHIEKMTFNLKDFLKKKIRIPESEAEQNKIASVLQQADKEIELLKAQKQQIENQKKGLIQQLLTGKVRVNNLN